MFENKGFNSDLNNDIKYKFVEVLYIIHMKRKFIGIFTTIYKGGLDYVKSCLNINDKVDYSQIDNKQ